MEVCCEDVQINTQLETMFDKPMLNDALVGRGSVSMASKERMRETLYYTPNKCSCATGYAVGRLVAKNGLFRSP